MARRAKGDGTLRKRKDGRWEGWFNIGTDENGKIKRKSVTAKTKIECQEKLNKAKEDYFNEQKILNSHTYLTNSDPTLNEWYEIWINTFCKNVIKDYTVQGYAQRFRLYILPELGNLKLSEISTVICQQFLINLYNNGRERGAGLPRIRFHDLRHSFATLSLEQGVDIKTVSHMLGHTDAGFTMNTYMHVTDNMQQTVADTMGTLLDSSVKDSKIVKFPA